MPLLPSLENSAGKGLVISLHPFEFREYYGHCMLVSVIVIGIRRRCRLRWLPGCRQTGSETAVALVQPFLFWFGKHFRFESLLVTILLSHAEVCGVNCYTIEFRLLYVAIRVLRLLRKWLGTEVLAAGILIVDLGSMQKGLCDAFGLWNLRFEDMGAEVTKSLLFCCYDTLYYFSYGLLYPRLYLDIICKRDRNCIDYFL
ncbi:uncharacterized protein LOC110267567 [Arachis ipaensis]|uniref:uncharacterized protein LOC110267567 n=1 Tax=Arachis ipaensis TaxID=130454 RepID=UPI000A2AF975|nr:uncharacterized protein LOC110267567 [Arachis ipaensis]